MQKITPFLWFNNNAEEAVNLYMTLFKNSKIKTIARYGDEGAKVSGQPAGSVMTISFEIEGQEFIALNGGPVFTFSQATSFVINCETQEEIDFLWEKLSEDGEKQPCGWLKDKFGVTWQLVPAIFEKLMSSSDAEKSKRVMSAMLKMTKPDIKALKQAYEQE